MRRSSTIGGRQAACAEIRGRTTATGNVVASEDAHEFVGAGDGIDVLNAAVHAYAATGALAWRVDRATGGSLPLERPLQNTRAGARRYARTISIQATLAGRAACPAATLDGDRRTRRIVSAIDPAGACASSGCHVRTIVKAQTTCSGFLTRIHRRASLAESLEFAAGIAASRGIQFGALCTGKAARADGAARLDRVAGGIIATVVSTHTETGRLQYIVQTAAVGKATSPLRQANRFIARLFSNPCSIKIVTGEAIQR